MTELRVWKQVPTLGVELGTTFWLQLEIDLDFMVNGIQLLGCGPVLLD